MDQYLQIRLLHRDGLSIREIARRLGHGRDLVRKALVEATPRPYTRTRPVVLPKLRPFVASIEQILAEDALAPPKQRHTAMRIFQRLRDEQGYDGRYDQVCRYPPGSRLECDFGHVQVDFPEGRRPVPVLLAVWSYSQ